MAKEETFWLRVEKALDAKNWTQAELVRKSGVSAPTLSHWKGGAAPSVDQLSKVSKALGLSMDQLWGATAMPDLLSDAGRLSKPESDLVVLYRGNERFRRIVNNIIAELELRVEDDE